MGADALIVFYGLRFSLNDAEVDAIENRTDARVIAAQRAKLQTYCGRVTDGQPHFLLIGTRLGVFGVENESERSIDAPQWEQVTRETTAKLVAAGLTDPPQLHFQLEAQY